MGNLFGCQASFIDLGMSPRALGMGSAFTGLADDAAAVYYNPAGIGQLLEKEIGISYASLYPGLTYPEGRTGMGDAFMSYVHPMDDRVGTVGFAWINRSISDLYSENSYIFSYGRKLTEKVYVGANIKVLQLSYSRSHWGTDIDEIWTENLEDPIFANGTSAFGLGLDLGMLVSVNDKLRIGLCMKDFNQPDVHLLDPNPTPMTIKVGANYDMGEYRILMDVTSRNYDYYFNSGFEWWMVEFPIGVRGGFGIGSRNYLEMSTGASYLLIPDDGPLIYEFDYAFIYSLGGLEGAAGSHRLGMTLRIR